MSENYSCSWGGLKKGKWYGLVLLKNNPETYFKDFWISQTHTEFHYTRVGSADDGDRCYYYLTGVEKFLPDIDRNNCYLLKPVEAVQKAYPDLKIYGVSSDLKHIYLRIYHEFF